MKFRMRLLDLFLVFTFLVTATSIVEAKKKKPPAKEEKTEKTEKTEEPSGEIKNGLPEKIGALTREEVENLKVSATTKDSKTKYTLSTWLSTTRVRVKKMVAGKKYFKISVACYKTLDGSSRKRPDYSGSASIMVVDSAGKVVLNTSKEMRTMCPS